MYIKIDPSTQSVIGLISDFDPVFPGVPIEERYPADYINSLMYVPDEEAVGIEPNMVYDKNTGIFDYPVHETSVVDTTFNSVREAADAKIEECSAACNEAIVNGVEILGKQYSLTMEDQIMLESLKNSIKDGATVVPYHANDLSCELYTAEEFMTIYKTCEAHITQHRTYFNQLKQYIRSLTTIEDITAVRYGQPLTGEYLEKYTEIITALA